MTEPTLRSNPYVGLRPFFERDSLYFFGRGQQTAELLEILHQQRFLGIVGSSGSGKSSLLRAGVLPKLLGGFLAQDRDRWRIVRMKPGGGPLRNLAAALLESMSDRPPAAEDQHALEERIRADHTDALIEFLHARLEPNANLFLLVDQFEEIFRFRDSDKAEASDFVDLLLRLGERRDLPIYVALTMRTDFLGECDVFYGLPEALNRGRYLVPRLTRQQLREAIEGPARLLGARIEPRLLDYLLNELGDRFDRLPVLQHALLRTWDAWQRSGSVGSIDFPHYDAAGRLDEALDRDAEAALIGLDVSVASAIFKRLTDTDVSARRVRSPARVSQLMDASGADRATVEATVRRFEEGGRNFLYTSDDGTPEDPRVDIAHESLIRQWRRLGQWVDDERRSRDRYRELVARARNYEWGEAALLQDPDLRMAVDWRGSARPSAAWAERYEETVGDFESLITYLDTSVQAQSHTLADAELGRRWKIWNALILMIVLALALVSETWFSHPPAGEERGSAVAAPAVRTARIGDVEWTIDDRATAVDWDAAEAYCDDLTVRSRSAWRLPTTGELRDIYDPADVSASGLKIKEPFHEGVASRWIWSGESDEGAIATSVFAADFVAGMFVPVPMDFAGGVRVLCVRPPQVGRAQGLASTRAGIIEALRAYRPLGVFVVAYLVLASLGKRLHRRMAFPGILARFVAAGGRNPFDIQAAGGQALDAPAVHNTTYASTSRRIFGYAMDMAIHLAFLFVVFVIIVILEPVPVTVTLPSGEVLTGTHEIDDGRTVTLTMADGSSRTFPLNRGPRLDIIGGVPVAATLPTGAKAEGRSFDRLQVAVTLPSEERIEGTLVETGADHVTLTTAGGETRSIALDPNTPRVDIFWPPSDAGLAWLAGIGLVFGWLYEAMQISSQREATLGMRAAGIFRTDLQGGRLSFARASAWYGYRLLSYLAYFLGFASQPFTKRRQTFHDWMAASVVLLRPKPVRDRP